MLVHKTVRLPFDLIEYIEAQEGRSFSEKLINLLIDIREGDANRQRILADYDKRISYQRSRYIELKEKIFDASELLYRLYDSLTYAEEMLEKSKPEEPGSPNHTSPGSRHREPGARVPPPFRNATHG